MKKSTLGKRLGKARHVRLLGLILCIGFLVGYDCRAETGWKAMMATADSLAKERSLDSAIGCAMNALQLAEAELGKKDTSVAKVLYRIGIYYYRKRDVPAAEVFWLKSHKIREELLDEYHPQLGESINTLAIACQISGRIAAALSLYQRALLIAERATKPDSLGIAIALSNIGGCFKLMGRYAEAIPYLERCLTLRGKTTGVENDKYAGTLENLAVVLRELGRYAEAEPLHKRVLEIIEKTNGRSSLEYADVLNNFANTYSTVGKFAEAGLLLKQCAAIYQEKLGVEHVDYAAALDNLGVNYFDRQDWTEAESLYAQVLRIREKALGSDHPLVATSLNNYGNLFAETGRLAEAEPLTERALAIREKAYGPDHLEVAQSLHNLGNLHFKTGHLEEAEEYIRRAILIRERELGVHHPLVAESRQTLAIVLRAKGEPKDGAVEAGRALAIQFKSFHDNVYVLSESEALGYSRATRTASDSYLSSLVDIGSSDRVHLNEVSRVILESKGIVSDGIFARRQALVTEGDSLTLQMAAALRFTRFQLSRLYSAGPGDDTTGQYRHELDSLAKFANDQEAALSSRSVSFHRQQELRQVTVAQIDSLLEDDFVFVEYLRWDYHQIDLENPIPRYLALVIRKDRNPVIIHFGDASEIELLVETYLRQMRRVASGTRYPSAIDMADYRAISEALYRALWEPLEGHLSKGQTVLIGLDGPLNLVSFAGLMDDAGMFLAEKYLLHHLSSGRDLIRLKWRSGSGAGLLAMGDPDFDASIEARHRPVDKDVYASVEVGGESGVRNVRSGCGSVAGLQVESLPFTRTEVFQLVRQWSGQEADSAELYVGAKSTEDAFKAKAPGKRSIHLATHGYFLSGDCVSRYDSPIRSRTESSFAGENPLLQAGLLLSGANLHGAGCDSAQCDDGILSAFEVASLNLTGTDLVVLSACETGIGEVRAGEGVYGLRRAFQMAGARTVISALWPVSDQTTAEMMGQLYARDRDLSIVQRMRQMQLEQLKKLRDANLPEHPFLWAGFTALGDWR